MTKKNRIWLVVAVVVLVLVLVGVAGSCQDRRDTESPPKGEVTEKVPEKDAKEPEEDADEEAESEGDNTQETTAASDGTEEVQDGTEEEPSSATQGEQTNPRPAHTHKWEDSTKTVHHDVEGHYEKKLVKEAWTEKVPVYENQAREICGNCGADVTENPGEHIKQHMLNGTGTKGCHTEYRDIQVGTETINHPAEYKNVWVVDKKAWDETVPIKKCSTCGKTK